jgi:anti-sigma-K factor RskA
MDRDDQKQVDELLMQRVTGALSGPEAEALSKLVAQGVDKDVAEWEAAAAELSAVLATESRVPADELPAALADRIVGVGEVLVRTSRPPSAMAYPPVVPPPTLSNGPSSSASSRSSVDRLSRGRMVGRQRLAAPVGLSARRAVVRTPGLSAIGAQLRDSLLNADSSLTRLAWSATPDSSAKGATGDVVWSGKAQRGVMRIAGLQANDRTRWQYQLWIFDKKRDQRYPVDGGVFDIPAGSHEVFVPIDARIPVGEAVMFAVTVEPVGGVVVSTRERIALLAKS